MYVYNNWNGILDIVRNKSYNEHSLWLGIHQIIIFVVIGDNYFHFHTIQLSRITVYLSQILAADPDRTECPLKIFFRSVQYGVLVYIQSAVETE